MKSKRTILRSDDCEEFNGVDCTPDDRIGSRKLVGHLMFTGLWEIANIQNYLLEFVHNGETILTCRDETNMLVEVDEVDRSNSFRMCVEFQQCGFGVGVEEVHFT